MTRPIEARVKDDSLVREEVFAHITDTFGLNIHRYVPNFFGLLNRKWIITTDSEKLFVKCYHPKRYPWKDTDRWSKIRCSLSFQQLLYEQANVCPRVWHKDGQRILQSPSGHFYVVMQYADGYSPQAGQVGTEMMRQVGRAAGRMHDVLSRYPADGVVWTPSLTTMKEKWHINLHQALEESPPTDNVVRILERQGHLLSSLDMSIFEELEPGWAHWDCWVDNMLVGKDGEVRFVDFDTVQFSYPEIDLARTLLSCALYGGELQPEPTAAFLSGYREARAFPRGRVPLALKLLWCREAHWWLKTGIENASTPPKRFAEEMTWLTDHWQELDERYGGW